MIQRPLHRGLVRWADTAVNLHAVWRIRGAKRGTQRLRQELCAVLRMVLQEVEPGLQIGSEKFALVGSRQVRPIGVDEISLLSSVIAMYQAQEILGEYGSNDQANGLPIFGNKPSRVTNDWLMWFEYLPIFLVQV